MKTLITLAILFSLTIIYVSGQDIVTDLYGFRLGQLRETATNELGKPLITDKYDDGFEYEVHLLKPDSSLFMVFEFAAGLTDIIWSLQISGSDTTTDIKFKNLKLGMDKSTVKRLIGKPSNKVNAAEYGERWEYDKINYSFEINKIGKLSSIKIKDVYLGQSPDVSKIPSFDKVAKALTAKKNIEISAILAPSIEIYYNNKTLFFTKSFLTEINNDNSKVYETIKTISKGLDKIDKQDRNVYEENMRLSLGQNPMHVIKIKKDISLKKLF